MKYTGRITTGSIFLLAFVALVVVGVSLGYSNQDKGKSASKEEPPCDEDFCLEKTSTKGTLHLVYRFRGLHDERREVACDVREDEVDQELRKFGYLDSERERTRLQYLERAINLGLRLSPPEPKPEYGRAQVTKYSIEWVPSGELPPLVGEKILAEERVVFFKWYGDNQKQLSEMAKQKFLQDHGFTEIPGLGEVPDYASIVTRSAPALKSCIAAFDQDTGGQPEILQAFFQAMLFERILDRDSGKKWIGGFTPPLGLMTQSKGDCDSKAAAFCALRRKRESSLVILRSLPGKSSPRHALVGVEAWKKDGSHPTETWPYKRVPEALRAILYGDPIPIGLRSYWPCEVAGRRRTAYGEVEPGHEGEYIAIRIQ